MGSPSPSTTILLFQLVRNLDKVTPALDETRQDGLEGGVRRRDDIMLRRIGIETVLHYA